MIRDLTGTANRCQGHNMCDMHVRDTVVVTAQHRHVRDTIGMLGTPKKSETPQMCQGHHRSVIDSSGMAGTSQKCQRCTWHGRDTTDFLKTPQRRVRDTTYVFGTTEKCQKHHTPGQQQRVRGTTGVFGSPKK